MVVEGERFELSMSFMSSKDVYAELVPAIIQSIDLMFSAMVIVSAIEARPIQVEA